MLYEEVFKKFEGEGIRYLVVGGIAVNLYGYARLTVDLDLMLDLSRENLFKVVTAMGELGYVPRVPVEAHDLASEKKRRRRKEEKGALVFTFIDPKVPFRHVDVFLENPINFEQAYHRCETFQLRDIRVPVASIDDLIQMKSGTGRPRDQEDIHTLKRNQIAARPLMGTEGEDIFRYAYRKQPLDRLYPDLADVQEEFILEWFKDRYDYPRFHTSKELQEMISIPPEAILQWLEEAGEFVWTAKRKEWEERRLGKQLR